MCLSEEFWESKPCWKGNVKRLPRDKVEVADGEVCYLLWGNPIAVWNKTRHTLKINDCGWESWLTFNRLNALLSNISFSIYSIHRATYLSNPPLNAEYKWQNIHTINLDTLEVNPCIPRKTNPKASKTLRTYYATASELIRKRKLLIAQTLEDELVCLLPMQYGSSRFSLPIFGLYANDNTLRAYTGQVACSKVYSAFMKNNPIPLANHLAQRGRELCGQNILSTLTSFQVDTNLLPDKVVQHLALMRLLEDD